MDKPTTEELIDALTKMMEYSTFDPHRGAIRTATVRLFNRLQLLADENERLKTNLAKANGSLREIDNLVKDGSNNLYEQVMPIVRIVYETLKETSLYDN